jgi:hypothetical protein
MISYDRKTISGDKDHSGIRQFTWDFGDLGITTRDMELYLGFEPGNVPDPFPEMIEAAFSEAPGLFEIRTGYRIMDTVQFHRDNHTTETEGVIFSTGKVVFSQMQKAIRLAFFAGTAGQRVTERCRELNRLDESVYSYALDVMGSLVAGKSVDRMMDDLEADVSHSGCYISESYSPGYCDWDVSEQQKLFTFFPPGFLRITLSSSSLMSPVKSVSGIIGIGPEMKRNGYQCHLCTDTSCFYGKIRRENQMK